MAAFGRGVDSLRDRVLEPQKWPPSVTTELQNLVMNSQIKRKVIAVSVPIQPMWLNSNETIILLEEMKKMKW